MIPEKNDYAALLKSIEQRQKGNDELELSATAQRVRDAMAENRARRAEKNGKQTYSPLWWFAKALKHEWQDLDAEHAAKRVDESLCEIYPKAVNPWQVAFPASKNPRKEFLDTWSRIKHVGKSTLREAWAMAQKRPIAHQLDLRPGSVEARYADLAFYMDRLSEGDWYTAQTQAAKLLGCERMQIWRVQQELIDKGIICKTDSGCYVPGGQGTCSRFRFDPAKFDAVAKALDLPT
jgi:hypothetical protein